MKSRISSGSFLIVGFAMLLACGEAESQEGTSDIRVPFDTRGWATDFTKHSVSLDEIMSGGPPKDGIPPVDNPRFTSVAEADRWIGDREPIIVFEHGGIVRGYPWQILIWHEIVNDEVGGLPVTVTYCPLCNTAIAFDRRVGGRTLDFGTTGRLRHSDLVMYDRQTESWWQQAIGEAIVGEYTGTQLTFLAAPTLSWRDFKAAYPTAEVLSRDTGNRRDYGRSPYSGYDTGRPFLFRGPIDGRLPMMERVVVVKVEADAVVYPMKTLAKERVINHSVSDRPVVLFYIKGTASAVDDSRISEGREVGSATVYSRSVGDRTLTFRRDGESFVDEETGTHWNLHGMAISGPLEGRRLEEVVSYIPFWFAWGAFRPDDPIYGQ